MNRRTGRRARWIATAAGAVAVSSLPSLLAGGAPAAVAGPAPATKPAPAPKPAKILPGTWGDLAADIAALGSNGTNQPALDPGSLYTITNAIGARQVWLQHDAKGRAITGQGVTVALVDSGTQPVAGLDAPGKLALGPDLSLETNSAALRGQDDFGHGTHLAGIIAAHDPTALDPRSGGPVRTDPSQQLGVAPDAHLLALKLATADGSTDVSQVIAALDWVSQHAHDNGMNVRVVNLSFGTGSIQPYQLDPLAAAAENAWHHGIVVVVSGGNNGASAAQLADPAIDPFVIAVGASTPHGSVLGWLLPGVADFSSAGTTQRHVDLVAPGTSIASLRDPGSFIDTNFPTGLVAGDTTGRLFRGSGTSQAAAVVSGAAALVLQANPALTPDMVKAALVSTAHPIVGADPTLAGAGELDVNAAVAWARKIGPRPSAATVASYAQSFAWSAGDGSLEDARGGIHLVDPDNGVVLAGETDVQGRPFDAAAWDARSRAGTAWTGGTWNGAQWTGNTWNGPNWVSTAWPGTRWSGARWLDADWDGARWLGARWLSSGWDGARWLGARWLGARWLDAGWS